MVCVYIHTIATCTVYFLEYFFDVPLTIYVVSLDIMKKATLLQKSIKWQYLNGDGEFIGYNAEVNYYIEQAYQKYRREKQNSIFHCTCEENNLAIYFESNPMQEENCYTRKSTEIRRIYTAKMNQGNKTYTCTCIKTHGSVSCGQVSQHAIPDRKKENSFSHVQSSMAPSPKHTIFAF